MGKSSERIRSPSAAIGADRKFVGRFSAAAGLPISGGSLHGNVGWVGAGTLHFKTRDLHVTAKRLTLFGQRRTLCVIRPEEIRAVYREDNSIRFDLLTGRRRWFFDFSAADASVASEILELLPASRTIELETAHKSLAPAAGQRRIPLLTVVLCVAVCAGLVTLLLRSHSAERAANEPTTPAQVASASRLPAVLNADAIDARGDLETLLPRIGALEAQFSVAFDSLQTGSLSQRDFADGLDRWLQPQWQLLAARLPADRQANSPVRAGADDQLKAIIVNWQQALTTYAEGLRRQDPDEVMRALSHIGVATDQRRHAQALLEKLDVAR